MKVIKPAILKSLKVRKEDLLSRIRSGNQLSMAPTNLRNVGS
jgi:hypothetical protein